MSRFWLAGTSALALVTVCVAFARAEDISAKKILIKDNTDPTKRQVLVLSGDVGVQLIEADDPGVNGAAIHVYSTTDDFCANLPAGADWQNTGTLLKYKNATTKNSARIGDGKLLVKIKSGVTYSLADNGTQGDVNVQVQFGSGTRYCMRCSGNTKNDAKKFLGKNCVAAPCDAEPSPCLPSATTTSTSTSTSTSSTCPTPTTNTVKGSLVKTLGHFTYNLTPGVPGADSACNTNFAGTHACTLANLMAAPASDLTCLKDTTNMTVTSFWAIDPTNPNDLQQCVDDAFMGTNQRWEYGTAHTASRGELMTLDSTTGTLGTVQMSQQCNGSLNWVACCQ